VIFIALWSTRETMKAVKSLSLAFTLVLSVTVLPVVSMAESGNEITIENDVTWELEDAIITQDIRIINGGSLTLSNAQYSIEPGVEIYVDSESSFNVSNSDLVASDPPANLEGFGYCDEGNRSGVRVLTSSSNTVRVTFWPVEGLSLDGYLVYFGGWTNNTEEMSGDEYSIVLGAGPIDLWLGLVGPMCDVTLSQIGIYELDSNFEVVQSEIGPAANFQSKNMMVKGDPGFTITVDGGMVVSDSAISGGQISAKGNLTINDTLLHRVGPILMSSDSSSISLGGFTSFEQSTDDHDVRARTGSHIHWGEHVNGTGGLTDKWERVMGSQRLVFDAVFVYYEISGMHSKNSYWNYSDSSGVSYIDSGKERVVEIAWSDDNVWAESPIWTEEAVVSISDYRTAWNPENSGISDYGGGQFALPWVDEIRVNDSIPNIGWSSLEVIGDGGGLILNATIGDSLNVKALLSNSGSAAAIVAISCYIPNTGSDADISPQYPNAMIGPGLSEEIEFSWRVAEEGPYAITCEILTPTQLVNESAFGGGELSSSVVNWDEKEEGEGPPYLLPLMISVIIGTGLIGYIISRHQTGEIDD